MQGLTQRLDTEHYNTHRISRQTDTVSVSLPSFMSFQYPMNEDLRYAVPGTFTTGLYEKIYWLKNSTNLQTCISLKDFDKNNKASVK